jgi:hypothetical protein
LVILYLIAIALTLKLEPYLFQGVYFLNDFSEDISIAEVHQAIGNLVIRFPLLHCEECATTLKQWLKQRGIRGKLWRLSTKV